MYSLRGHTNRTPLLCWMAIGTRRRRIVERFHRLACETHRTEAEIIEEALSININNDAQYVEVLRQRMDAADRTT